jgi:hypothetical protein
MREMDQRIMRETLGEILEAVPCGLHSLKQGSPCGLGHPLGSHYRVG